MKHQKPKKQSNEINILGFGPIRLPIMDEQYQIKKTAIKKHTDDLDSIFSVQAILKKLLHKK